MTMRLTPKILLALDILLLAGSALCQNLVTGVVLDPQGRPLPGASVEAFPVQSGGFAASLSWTKSDDYGAFHLSLRPGRYEIRGKDEPEGYPDPNALLAVDPEAHFPEVSVEKRDIDGIQVRLGQKGGILDGSVRDEQTGKPVAKAKVTLRDARKPEAFVEVFPDELGHFRFTVPSRPIVISAAADGYAPAHPREGGELMLSGGEHRSLLIEFRRK